MQQKKNLGFMLVVLTIFSGICLIMSPAQARISQFNEREQTLLVPEVVDGKYTWEVKKSFGIYAYNAYHVSDKINFTVLPIDQNKSTYQVNVSRSYWLNNSWAGSPLATNASIYIIPRNWGSAAESLLDSELIPAWRKHPIILQAYVKAKGINNVGTNWTGIQILEYLNSIPGFWSSYLAKDIEEFTFTYVSSPVNGIMKITYSDEWFQNRLINMVNIQIKLDESNYDILKYTRSEGILIQRDTKIFIEKAGNYGNPLTGSFAVELQSYSKELIPSFWTYIIWFAIIFGIVMGLIIFISIMVNRRQRKLRELDY